MSGGRWGGRSSDKAGLRDRAGLALDALENAYNPIEGGSIISLDAARKQLRSSSPDDWRSQAGKKAAETRKANQETKRFEAEKQKTYEAFGKIRANIAESYQRAREEYNKPKTDRAGVTLRGGEAHYKGTVIRPGGFYAPRNLLSRFGSKFSGMVFECTSVEWERHSDGKDPNDRIIAKGIVHYPGQGSARETRYYRATDLVPAKMGYRSGQALRETGGII
jgi:hypothetical protein